MEVSAVILTPLCTSRSTLTPPKTCEPTCHLNSLLILDLICISNQILDTWVDVPEKISITLQKFQVNQAHFAVQTWPSFCWVGISTQAPNPFTRHVPREPVVRQTWYMRRAVHTCRMQSTHVGQSSWFLFTLFRLV